MIERRTNRGHNSSPGIVEKCGLLGVRKGRKKDYLHNLEDARNFVESTCFPVHMVAQNNSIALEKIYFVEYFSTTYVKSYNTKKQGLFKLITIGINAGLASDIKIRFLC